MATESVPYSGEMIRNLTKMVDEPAARPVTKLVERTMPVTFENNDELFHEWFAFDPNGKRLPELVGAFGIHLDRVTVRYCMELVRWGNRLRLAEALKDAYSRKCEGEYCLGNDSTRAEPCNQPIEASTDPEVVLCKKCREDE